MPGVLSTLAGSSTGTSIQQAFATTTRRAHDPTSPVSVLFQYILQNKALALSTCAVAAVFAYALRDQSAQTKALQERLEKEEQKEKADGESSVRSARVDSAFWSKLLLLIRIAIPGVVSRESAFLAVLAGVLGIRTYLSIRITGINGEIVKAIVQRDFPAFLRRLAVLASMAIPASIVNSLLKYLRGKLALCFRERLVTHFHHHYLQKHMFYSVINLDQRITNPDQALTETIDKWSVSLAQLYSDITKPLLDICLFALKINQVIGWLGPVSVVGYYFFCGLVIQTISPKFGKMTAETQRLEGAFRNAHHRLIISSEEVAFYGGQDREKEIITAKFKDVISNQSEFFRKQLSMGVLDGFLTKYGAVLLGYSVLGLPVFGPGSEIYNAQVASDPAQITRDYVRNSGLLINFSQAIGRIVTSYKELQKLAGFTSLVGELEDVLNDLEEGRYERTMLTHTLRPGLAPGAGVVVVNEEVIAFDDVPIVTPNGCGKSSLFRILGGLWPIWGGRLSRPSDRHLFYIPQKPYLCGGTLRDNIIYPERPEHMQQKGTTDADLVELLRGVHLLYLLERPGGWEAEEEWADVLSGGEKQRVAMARLFYHKPYFAILDECTSAVSVDVEGFMYRHCRDIGVTLLTISHRQTLWQYHDYMLRFEDEPNPPTTATTAGAGTGNGVPPLNTNVDKDTGKEKAKRFVSFRPLLTSPRADGNASQKNNNPADPAAAARATTPTGNTVRNNPTPPPAPVLRSQKSITK